MSYLQTVTKAGSTLIIEKYYSSRWHKKGITRGANVKKTTEAQEKCNQRKAERKVTILLNANFHPGDWHLVLDYRMEHRPETTGQARDDIRAFLEKLRRIYRKAGVEMKYVEAVEFGKKGGLHHHMILNSLPEAMEAIRTKWPYGRVHFNLMDDTGEYSELASYILKKRKYWKEAGGKGKQYSSSRNLFVPETKKEVITTSDGYYEKPREKKGYYLKKDTEVHFTTDAGWPYMRYILVKEGGRSP